MARKKPQRARKGSGTVIPYGKSQWRARKRQAGFPDALGSVRETWDEAEADRLTLASPKELYESKHEGEPESRTPTLRAFVQDYLTDPAKRRREVAYGTWAREENTWRNRIYPSELGATPLDEITGDHVQAFLDQQRYLVVQTDALGRPRLVDKDDKPIAYHETTGKPLKKNGRAIYTQGEKPISRAEAKRIKFMLSTYFRKARSKRHRFMTMNILEEVELPAESRQTANKRSSRRSLTPAQAAGLQANLLTFLTKLQEQGPRFEVMVMTQRDTGLRRGELCAIKWINVRRISGQCSIAIPTAITRVENGLADEATKTGRPREFPIGEETFERLMTLPRISEYVFTTKTGNPVRPDNYNRSFRAFAKEIGMPDLKPHSLRFTFISLMLRAGVDLKAIQKSVGHSSPRMIMEIYGETFDESQVESVAKFKRVLDDAAEGNA